MDVAGETGGWPATPPRPRSARGAFAVLIVSLVVTIVGGALVLVRASRPPSSREAAVREIVSELTTFGRPNSTSFLLSNISWRDLTTCLDLDSSGRPRHPITISTSDPGEQVRAIAKWLQADRHLTFHKIPTPVFVSREGMAVRLGATERPPASPASKAIEDRHRRFIEAIGEPRLRPTEPNADTLADPPLGVYVVATKQLLVQGEYDGALSEQTAVIAAHEMEHALVHQNNPIAKWNWKLLSPRAVNSLIEGDATLSMLRFRVAAFGTSMQRSRSATTTLTTVPLDARHVAPSDFLVQQFPYVAGFAYACTRFADRGYRGIDTMYQVPKLLTTANILFPDRPVDNADWGAEPRPPGGGGWHREALFGTSAEELLVYSRDGRVPDIMRVLADLDGGWYGQWRRGTQTAVRFSYRAFDGAALCLGVRAWQQSVSALARTGNVTCSGHHVELDIVHNDGA